MHKKSEEWLLHFSFGWTWNRECMHPAGDLIKFTFFSSFLNIHIFILSDFGEGQFNGWVSNSHRHTNRHIRINIIHGNNMMCHQNSVMCFAGENKRITL